MDGCSRFERPHVAEASQSFCAADKPAAHAWRNRTAYGFDRAIRANSQFGKSSRESHVSLFPILRINGQPPPAKSLLVVWAVVAKNRRTASPELSPSGA
jgi:hypothetical protein